MYLGTLEARVGSLLPHTPLNKSKRNRHEDITLVPLLQTRHNFESRLRLDHRNSCEVGQFYGFPDT